MGIEEMEKKAASILTEHWHGQDTVELAEAVLLLLPVVRAAESPDVLRALTDALDHRNGDWACSKCRPHSDILKPGFTCGPHSLLDALDQMRREC